jgi:hypothetical protein
VPHPAVAVNAPAPTPTPAPPGYPFNPETGAEWSPEELLEEERQAHKNTKEALREMRAHRDALQARIDGITNKLPRAGR